MHALVLPDIPYLKFNDPVTLTNCDREPIHVPGHIQAHGALLVLNPADDLTILQASENLPAYCGILLEDLLGEPAAILFDAQQLNALQNVLESEQLESNPLYLFTGLLGGKGPFHLTGHVFQGLLTIEIIPVGDEETGRPDYYPLIKQALVRFRSATLLSDFYQMVCEEVRKVNGFDHVMVHKFYPDGHFEVVGEAIQEPDISKHWLGLHYPEGDIPKQARALLVLNTLRMTPDTRYTPSPVLPAFNPLTGKPLDMRYCLLRGVSKMCTEQLINMGVLATMSLAIIKDGQLWGLIACHHKTPRYVPYDVRAACEFLADIISLQITEKEAQEFAEYHAQIQTVSQKLIANVARQGSLLPALAESRPDALSFVEADGCAILSAGQCSLLGQTPSEDDVRALTQWLHQTYSEDVRATDSLSEAYPPAAHFKEKASGLLVLCISKEADDWILWFRPETIYTVKWGVGPNKPVEAGPTGDVFTPRKSFVPWLETVRNRSVSWNRTELEAARSLCASLRDILSRQDDKIFQLNAELAKSNAELVSFAYSASHDLKEPLRGISNYARFLQEDYGETLDAEGQEQIATLMRLARRMDSLLDSLLQYSRLGQQELVLETCDMAEIIQEAVQSLQAGRLKEEDVDIHISQAFPAVRCDRVQVGEVFSNLITNAIKYNNSQQKRVEIGWIETGNIISVADQEERSNQSANEKTQGNSPVFYVRDNGIGIPAQHLESIFTLFSRLHGRDEYGGGTGAGLTIVRQIIERHGGNLRVESIPGEGSTFYFTLSRGSQ